MARAIARSIPVVAAGAVILGLVLLPGLRHASTASQQSALSATTSSATAPTATPSATANRAAANSQRDSAITIPASTPSEVPTPTTASRTTSPTRTSDRSTAPVRTGQDRTGQSRTTTAPTSTTTANPAPPAPDFGIPVSVGDATELVVVRAASTTATVGTLTAWQRDATGVWTRVLGPITADLGTAGIGTASEDVEHTPRGTFTLTQAFGVLPDPGTKLPYFRATTDDWWVSDTTSGAYNTHQVCAPGSCPFDESAGEDLGRIVPQYDYAVVLDVNRDPVVRGAGSAFFLHVSDGGPTQGCVSVDRSALVTILRWLDPADHPRIAIGVDPA